MPSFSFYVLISVATYHYEPLPVETFKSKIERSINDKRFPFVATENDKILGCAYGSEHRVMAGYHKTIEDSIFIHPPHQKRGLGKMLMEALVNE